MTITICGSISYYKKMHEVAEELESLGHIVLLPLSAVEIHEQNLTLESIDSAKETDTQHIRERKNKLITIHMNKIEQSDAILVINEEKNSISDYIGGNTFLEMGFAHAFGKKIYLLNKIPNMPYTDEIAGLLPVVLGGDISKISA